MTVEAIDVAPFERSRDDQAWARWLARSADAVLLTPFVLLAFGALGIAIELGRAPREILTWLQNPILSGIAELIAAFLFTALWEPLFLSNAGTTPGKWIMGVSVRRESGRRLSLPRALGRFVTLWFVGLGAGVPFLSFILMLMARAKLINDGKTGWDEQFDCVVEHKKRHPLVWGTVLVLAVGVSIAIRIWSRNAG